MYRKLFLINPNLRKCFMILATVLSLPLYSQIETVLQQGHRMHVSCLVFSPDGKYLASGSRDNTVKLWDVQTGREIRTFSNHLSSVQSVQFSGDGELLLTAGNDKRLIVQNVLNGDVLFDKTVSCDRMIRAVFDPTAKYILASDNQRYIYVYDLHTKELIGTYNKPYSAPLHSGWFSPDGGKLMVVGERKDIHIIDLLSKDTVQTVEFSNPRSFCFAPGGKSFVIGSVKLLAEQFDLESGEMIHHLENKEGIVCHGCNTDARFSPSGKYIVTASSKSGVVLWDASNGDELVQYTKEDERVDDVFFSSNDKYLSIVRDEETIVYDVKSGKELFRSEGDDMECLPAFSPNGKYFAFCTSRSRIELWLPSAAKRVRIFEGYLNEKKIDRKYKESNWFQSYMVQDVGVRTLVALSPDGKYALKGKIDSVFMQIDLHNGKAVKYFSGHTATVIALAYSPDGKRFASGCENGLIILWDAQTGEKISSFRKRHNVIFDLSFSYDSKRLVSSEYTGSMAIWDVETGKMLKEEYIDRVSPYCARFTPNGLYLARSNRASQLSLVESDACKVFREFVGHTDMVGDIDFTSDGRFMLSASRDGKVKVWDAYSGMQVCRFTQHKGSVHAVVADPLGRFVVSAGNDRLIRVWDPMTGTVHHTLDGHSTAVTSLKISNDGKKLVSCSIDGMIKVWDLDAFSEKFTYVQINRNDWIATLPSGYLDGSPAALKMVNYVSGTDVLPVGSLFEKFYTPGLIKRLNGGERFEGASLNIKSLLEAAPIVQLAVKADNSRSLLHSADSVEWYQPQFPLQVELTGRGKDVDETRVYCNKKLVVSDAEKLKLKAGKTVSRSYMLPLSTGNNEITVMTINEDHTESSPAEITVFYDGAETVSDLYIISVGINKYENPSYNLSYAVNDAKVCSKEIVKGGKTIFGKIEEYFVKDGEADKKGIDSAFAQISAKAQPSDVFLFHFAGHGAMTMGSNEREPEFFIIPNDVTQLYGNDELVIQKGISASELLEYSKRIQAGKQMFIIDACQSGGAVDAFASRGSGREKAIAQLARSSGTFFLLASGAMQFASEAKELGHGLFSYSILEALGGKADGGKLDKRITVGELKSYVENRVPELTQQYMLTPQYPTGYSFGQDFPIVVVK